MKSFGLCHEIIWPVILKSFGLSQDLPLSQNGQNFRQENILVHWKILIFHCVRFSYLYFLRASHEILKSQRVKSLLFWLYLCAPV